MLPNLIIPVLNRYDLLKRMVYSIDYPIRDVLIIDNGGQCSDRLLKKHPFIERGHILRMPSNLGVAASWNLGIKLFPHDDRWFFASNDMVYMPGALEKLSEARRQDITLSDMFPFWHTFALGEEVVKRVGLFDEALYPAYHEDKDMERRAAHFGVPIRKINIPTGHDNSSTIKSDGRLLSMNDKTFADNTRYYNNKISHNDYDQGQWDLERRRRNSWDNPR